MINMAFKKVGSHDLHAVINKLEVLYPEQHEFIQAVEEVYMDIEDVYLNNPIYQENRVLEYLAEPDRVISFRVAWENDQKQIEINRAWRVQYCNALGVYKGGLRFHPSVNVGVLKFLAFEQCFKNALTGLPLGGGKGGADFDPKGKSEQEVRRFCQAFMDELHKHIGSDTDVPAGDIGVGKREIGYMYGRYLKHNDLFTGVLTGKGTNYGGSFGREEATGYGTVYFLEEVLKTHNNSLKGKATLISGAGNVAIFAAFKAREKGAIVRTLSDSKGTLVCHDGFTVEDLEVIRQAKFEERITLAELSVRHKHFQYLDGKKPWGIEGEIAIPCATQNEVGIEDITAMHEAGVFVIIEGANMPLDQAAQQYAKDNDIIFIPGKAANAGGVAVSGLEMSQNALRIQWSFEKVDSELQVIMKSIHAKCSAIDRVRGIIPYMKGANINSFVKVADALVSFGMK